MENRQDSGLFAIIMKAVKFLRRIFSLQRSYMQAILVFGAFGLMVILSYLLGAVMENRHLRKDADTLVDYIEDQVNADLRELETMLGIVSETVRTMILQGKDFEEISRYMLDMSSYSQKQINGFEAIVGVFDVFNGGGLAGMFGSNRPDRDWAVWVRDTVPEFVLEERQWFKMTADAGGEMVLTDPYLNYVTREMSFFYARSIHDDHGNRLAVIGLDVMLSRLYKYLSANNRKFANNWMLLDRDLMVIAHYVPELLGKKAADLPGGLHVIANMKHEREVSGLRIVNHLGQEKVISGRRLQNGWYLGVAVSIEEYYRNLYNMQWTLIVLGFLMASALSIILVRIVKEKNRVEKRHLLMLDAAPFGVNLLDKHHNVIECNQAALTMFGITDKDKYKAEFHSFSPKYQPDGKRSKEKKEALLEEAFEGNGDSQFEWMHQSPDGELLPTEVTLAATIYEGQKIYLAYMRDLRVEKKMMQETQKAIEEKNALINMNNILNGLDVMIYVTEPDTGKILFMNDSMKEHYDIEGDCVGKLCYKILQDNFDKKCEFCPCYKLDKNPDEPVVWEERSTLTNRTYRNTDRYIDWPNGKKVHIQHSVDMTELINAKEVAEQSSRYKSAFLANMSHEIRTPMNAILGIAEIQLRDGVLSAEAADAFGKIYDSGDLLISIINDVLDLSKVEAGKLELNPVKYDIPSLVNDTVQLNRLRYESKPIQLSIHVDENTPLELFGDELRIKQVLNNVLSNAFKYTNDGGIEFSVFCEPSTKEGAKKDDVMLVFRVKDTGQGMTKKQIDTLFDEYTRFNEGANRTTIGAGLGMSITWRLVDLMQGSIDVVSEPSKGSEFTVRLPQKSVGSIVCGPALSEKLGSFRFQGMSIAKRAQFLREYMPYGSVLVVDDVESNVYVAKGMLMPYGLKVDTCNSGFAAIEKVQAGNVYDIIFMDHMMPKMDGIEATKIIRSKGYRHSIVALTANALVGHEEMFLKNDFDGFIPKPLDSRELNLILNSFIRDKKDPEVVEAARREQRATEQKGKNGDDASSEDIKTHDLKMILIRDIETAIVALEEISGKMQNLDGDDIKLYTTTVHGMKSALANIGEGELSAAARKLEQAGNERNLAVISSETAAFKNAMRELVEKMKQEECKVAENVEVCDADMAFLRENLLAVKEAAKKFDIRAVNMKLSELKQKSWSPDISKTLDDITMSVLQGAFDEAEELADKYLG